MAKVVSNGPSGYPEVMADIFTKQKRSEVMSAIRSRGNKNTEIKLIKILRSGGAKGWRRHPKMIGNPDFIFPKEKVAIFVDGCFWHSCPMHGRKPTSNLSYWFPKLMRTKKRDESASKALRSAGWRVLRIWEHELGNDRRILLRVRRTLISDRPNT